MKKYTFLIIIFAFIGIASMLTSCQKKEYITPAYFVGTWNLIKVEHQYLYHPGEKLIERNIGGNLAYEFKRDSTLIVTYNGEFVAEDDWLYSYSSGLLDMSRYDDDLYRWLYINNIWHFEDVSSKAFTIYFVVYYNDNVEKKEYDEKYTYYFEKKK